MSIAYSLPYFREYPYDENEGVTIVLPSCMNEFSVTPTPVDERIKIKHVEAGYWAI